MMRIEKELRNSLKNALVTFAFFFILNIVSCAEEVKGIAPPPGSFHYPIGVAADPAGDYIYVVSSNFDVGYTGGTVVPVDVVTHEILADSAIEIGSFGGELALYEKDGKAVSGFVAVRGDRSLIWFRIERDKDLKPVLTCSDAARVSGVALKCEGDYVVRGTEDQTIGGDPFAIEIIHDRENNRDFVLVGSIDGGTVSLFSIGNDLKPQFGDNTFFSRGIHSIETHPETGDVYITTRFLNLIHTAEISYEANTGKPFLASGIPIAISTGYGATYTNVDFSREILFGSGGNRCYVSYRAPSSLLIFDTSLENGTPRNLLTGIIPLEKSPSGLAVIKNSPSGGDMIYAVSFHTDSVLVIDPEKMLVIDSIKVGDGPYSIISVKRDDIGLWRAYVTNFIAHSVSVIDVNPVSPYFHKHIAEIR